MERRIFSLSFALILASTSAFSVAGQERVCKVTDPTGTPLNVRNAPNGRVIGTLKNDTEVYIEQVASDARGRSWAQVSSYRKGRRRIVGWVFREFISCYNRSSGAKINPEYGTEETAVAENNAEETTSSTDNTLIISTLKPKIIRTLPQRRTSQRTTQLEFTINRECDGGLCHFEIVSFNYRRNLTISVGRGDSSLSYYFSVHVTDGKVSKEYIYSDEPDEHFIEKESGQNVDPTLNKLLLDVYNLGNYVVEKDIAIRNRKFSETGRFAVLANLRKYL